MRIQPYLTFDGSCAEAFRFYAETLGGRIEMMMTHGEAPEPTQAPPEWRDRILHACLVAGDAMILGSDRPPQFKEPVGGFYVSLNVDGPADAERIFAALSKQGEVRLPLQETFFATHFAMLVDRFGIPWMIVRAKTPQ